MTDNQHIVKSFDDEINALIRQIIQMGGLVEKQVVMAIDSLLKRDVDLATRVIENDDKIDQIEEDIDQAAIRLLATRQPMAVDLRQITMALKISNDLERIGDYATNIARRSIRLAKTPPLKPLHTIPHMAQVARDMLKSAIDAYVQRDEQKAIATWHRDREVDDLYESLFRELVTYMLEEPRNITACIDLLFVAKHLERMGDHTCNIAEKIHYIIHGEKINRMAGMTSQQEPAKALP